MPPKPRPARAAKKIRKGSIGGKPVMVFPHEGTQLTVMENPHNRKWAQKEGIYRLSLGGYAKGGERPLMVRHAESIDWGAGGKVSFQVAGSKTTDPRHLAIYRKFGRKAILRG
jgi:hypothetical protein